MPLAYLLNIYKLNRNGQILAGRVIVAMCNVLHNKKPQIRTLQFPARRLIKYGFCKLVSKNKVIAAKSLS